MNFFDTKEKEEVPLWESEWWNADPPEATELAEAAELAKVSFEASFDGSAHDRIVDMIARAAKEEAAAGQYSVKVSLPGISRATRREVARTLVGKGFECFTGGNGGGNSGPSFLHTAVAPSEYYINVNWWPKE